MSKSSKTELFSYKNSSFNKINSLISEGGLQ